MHRSRKFCQRWSKFDNFFFFKFLVDEGIEDRKTAIHGPSSAQHLNGVFRWRANDGPTLNAGLVAL